MGRPHRPRKPGTRGPSEPSASGRSIGPISRSASERQGRLRRSGRPENKAEVAQGQALPYVTPAKFAALCIKRTMGAGVSRWLVAGPCNAVSFAGNSCLVGSPAIFPTEIDVKSGFMGFPENVVIVRNRSAIQRHRLSTHSHWGFRRDGQFFGARENEVIGAAGGEVNAGRFGVNPNLFVVWPLPAIVHNHHHTAKLNVGCGAVPEVFLH